MPELAPLTDDVSVQNGPGSPSRLDGKNERSWVGALITRPLWETSGYLVSQSRASPTLGTLVQPEPSWGDGSRLSNRSVEARETIIPYYTVVCSRAVSSSCRSSDDRNVPGRLLSTTSFAARWHIPKHDSCTLMHTVQQPPQPPICKSAGPSGPNLRGPPICPDPHRPAGTGMYTEVALSKTTGSDEYHPTPPPGTFFRRP